MIADEEMQMRARSCEGRERERDPSECRSGSGRVAERADPTQRRERWDRHVRMDGIPHHFGVALFHPTLKLNKHNS